jgi:hypothetical protein
VCAQLSNSATQAGNLEEAADMVGCSGEVCNAECKHSQRDDDYDGGIRYGRSVNKLVQALLQKLQCLGVMEGCSRALRSTRIAIQESPDREHHGMEAARVVNHVREPAFLHLVNI